MRIRVIVAVLMLCVAAVASRSPVAGQSGPDGPVMPAAKALAFMRAAEQGLRYAPGEVVVTFTADGGAGWSDAGRSRAMAGIRNRMAGAVEWTGPTTAIVRDASGADPAQLAESLGRLDGVAYAEPNYIYQVEPRATRVRALLKERDTLYDTLATTPNDPGFSARQWNLQQLDMPKAWDLEPGGSSSVIVAVVDTGITTAGGTYTFANWNGSAIVNQGFALAVNPDLAVSRLVSPYDFVNKSATVLDLDGHGTHVSGTIGQDTNNSVGDAGMAYKVRIMPVKVCSGYWDVQFARSRLGIAGQAPLTSGGCLNSDIAAGIRYAADNGASIVNLSLGGDVASATILDAIRYAVGKGVFVAAAGGNEYEDGNPVEYPAGDAPGVDGLMSVAAVGRSGNRAFYSNTGAHIEIAAPGGDSRDQSAGTGYIWQSTLIHTDSDPATGFYTPRFDRYAELGYQGTSMATPHVAGMAALVYSKGIRSAAAVEALIRRTAKDIGASGKDTSFGYGLIQPRAALFGVGVLK